jgi:hypothetical protein
MRLALLWMELVSGLSFSGIPDRESRGFVGMVAGLGEDAQLSRTFSSAGRVNDDTSVVVSIDVSFRNFIHRQSIFIFNHCHKAWW